MDVRLMDAANCASGNNSNCAMLVAMLVVVVSIPEVVIVLAMDIDSGHY